MTQSAYLHIPFCRSKCKYCSFISFANQTTEKFSDYVNALIKEILYFYKGEDLKTLYFGGGTPSLLSLNDIKQIFSLFKLLPNAEKTIEINPDTVDFNYLKGLREIGFNRLSIGIQSFDGSILNKIGRIHSALKARQVVIDAQQAGFGNISVDFIYGLPNQTLDGFLVDLKQAIELNVNHISLYGLKIEEGCAFYNEKLLNLPDNDMQADMYLAAIEFLEQKGFQHYEISNFSKPNYDSKHNLNYWSCGEYYGFGLGAHGFVDGCRYENVDEFDLYFKDFKTKSSVCKLTPKEKMEEFIFLGFRKKEGIDISVFNKKFNMDFDLEYKSILDKYLCTEHLLKTERGYSFSDEGFLLSNMILSEFL